MHTDKPYVGLQGDRWVLNFGGIPAGLKDAWRIFPTASEQNYSTCGHQGGQDLSEVCGDWRKNSMWT